MKNIFSKIRKIKNNDSGFSLVELIVVVVILILVSSVALTIYGDIKEQARRNSLLANSVGSANMIAQAIATTGGVEWKDWGAPTIYPWGNWCSNVDVTHSCDAQAEASWQAEYGDLPAVLVDYDGNEVLSDTERYTYYVDLNYFNQNLNGVFVVVYEEGVGYAYAGNASTSNGLTQMPQDVTSFPDISQSYWTLINN